MRLIGMLLALGAIGWALYQGSGGGQSDSAIPKGQRQALEKAEDLEKSLQAAAQLRLEKTDTE